MSVKDNSTWRLETWARGDGPRYTDAELIELEAEHRARAGEDPCAGTPWGDSATAREWARSCMGDWGQRCRTCDGRGHIPPGERMCPVCYQSVREETA